MLRPFLLRASSLALAAMMLLAALPVAALGLEPPRPLPSYRPAFVSEVVPGVRKDCIWASSAMLLDKWTNGGVIVTRERLRALSGDRGGSNFGNVRAAFAKLDVAFRYSPDGGDPMTWNGLLWRLSKGAGAVVLGDDSSLPRRLGRWDPTFWRKSGEDDNHAMYVDGYDRRSGRVFLMDPLAPAGWAGEWVTVQALRAFIWQRGGLVFAATTPTAKRAPFAGVKVGAPVAVADSGSIRFAWPVKTAARTWRLPGVDVHSTIAPLVGAAGRPDENVVVAPPVDRSARTTRRSIALVEGRIVVNLATPTKPGVYRVHSTLTERRFGRTVASSGAWTVYVPGERWAEYSVPDRLAAEAGDKIRFAVVVTNRGTIAWTTPGREPGLPEIGIRNPNARLVGTWIPAADDQTDAARMIPAPPSVVLGYVPLGAGAAMVVQPTIDVPLAPGRWALMITVVDDVNGTYDALGSAPGRIVIDVAAPAANVSFR